MKKTVVVLLMVMMAVGFDWSLLQGSDDIVKITIKNQFSVAVDFYINGKFACAAAANSSCTVRDNIRKAPFKLEAWGYTNTKVIASKTLDALAPGKNIIWATGNVELNPIPFPISSQAVANQTAPKGSAVSFMTSVATLNYQGQKAQNRAQTVSLAKIERQTSSTGATYALSGQGGFRIGKDGTAVFYKASPLTVSRNLSDDRLSSDKKGLSLWLTVINGTLNGLTHKHMISGAWEEPITLSLGDAFPETIHARFRAQPLPEPDSKWIVITADSGLISFRALDEKYQDSLIYGRYQGVLVYSPTEDAFLQAAAAFTLYHGEDQFRIEQLHFAADASGNQLNPVLDVGPYLNFKPEAPTIATQASFPSWCAQATQVLDILHLAIMTAAEGSTNPVTVFMVEKSILNLINHDYSAIEKILGKVAADEFLGNWMKILEFSYNLRKEGMAKAMYELAKDVSKDFILDVLPFGLGYMYKTMELEMTVAQAVMDKMAYDISKLTPFRGSLAPQSVRPETPPPPPPSDQIKQPKKGAGEMSPGTKLLLGVGGVLLAGVGVYALVKGLKGLTNDCEPTWICGETKNGIQTTGGLVLEKCDCPSNTRYAGMDNVSAGGPYKICACIGY
jgi:hypothetical protein